MSEFFYQGGYAYFVWSVYGMAGALLIAETLYLLHVRRALRARLQRAARGADRGDTGTT